MLDPFPAPERSSGRCSPKLPLRARPTHAALGLALFTIAQPAFGAEEPVAYPERPIRMLVGFAPGGGTDVTARVIAQKLSNALGQHVVVDNRPGAAGNIAAEIAARASPDGYTLLMGTIASLAINPTLYGNLPFDPLRDFAPITQAVSSTNVLAVHPSVQAYSVKDLIKLAKDAPGQTVYGSSGSGSAGHLAGELFCAMAKIRLTHVPYKGGAAVMHDIVGGQIDSVFATAVTAIPHIRSGKIRALGVTTAKRAGALPEIPTIAEQGLPGFDANNWYGVLGPARLPHEIVRKLNAEMVAILNLVDVKQYLLSRGLDPAPSTPEAFGTYIRTERYKWDKLVREVHHSTI